MSRQILTYSLLVFILSSALYGQGGGENRELSEWYEQAYSYYSGVQSGAEPKPGQAEWNEFISQMNWAREQLYGSDTKRNLTYRKPKTHITYIGEGRVHHVYSHDFMLDVASASAKVTVERSQDSSVDPPQEVIKVVVKDRATSKNSTYYLHNVKDVRSIRINTPGGKNVTDKTRSVKVGKVKYKKPKPIDKKLFYIRQ